MGIAVFGPGVLMATRLDIANPTPINVGYVQEFSIDLAGTTKQLFGQKQFPLVAARSTVKASGKMKNAYVSGFAMNTLFFGLTPTTGGWNMVPSEAGTIPAPSGPYTITVAGAANFIGDLGVIDALTGLPMIRVASGPATGQYSVNTSTGVYTFAAADASRAVLITYVKSVTSGQNLVVTNPDIGATPTFQLDYYTNLNQPTAKPLNVTLFSCVGGKMANAFKLEDFMMPEFDFDFFALPNGNVMKYSFPNVD